MRLLALGAVAVALMASAAQAQDPSPQKITSSKIFGQHAAIKAPASTKFLEAWVLHNPYKPEAVKLTFVN